MLENAVLVIAGVTCLQFDSKPMRRNMLLPDPSEIKNQIPLGDAVDFPEYRRKWRLPRSHAHLEIGAPDTDIQVVEGKAVGHGDEPRDNDIDTGSTVNDFQKGDQVLAWWWNRWLAAKVQYISKRTKAITLRWEWDFSVTSGYRPSLVMQFPKKKNFKSFHLLLHGS